MTLSEFGDLILMMAIFTAGITFIVVNVNYKGDDNES